MRTKQLILKELLEIIELWPDIPIARHLRVILRPNKDIYNWSDEKLLKKIEKYRYELDEEVNEEKGYNEEDDFLGF